MADEDDKNWVEVTVDAPKTEDVKADETPKTQDAAPPQEGEDKVKTAKRIKKLLRDRAEERSAREALQAELAELKKQVESQAQVQVQSTQTQYHTHRASLETKIASARERKKVAFEAGNFEAMDAADAELGDARLELRAFDAWTANQKRAEQARPTQSQAQAQLPAPRAAVAWASEHSEWFGPRGSDSLASQAAYAIADKLIKEGQDPQDEEFYKEIEKRLVEVMPHTKKYFEEGEASPKKPHTPVGGQSRTAAPSNKVKLSPEEVQLARQLGISPERYAKRKLESETQRDTQGWTEIEVPGAR